MPWVSVTSHVVTSEESLQQNLKRDCKDKVTVRNVSAALRTIHSFRFVWFRRTILAFESSLSSRRRRPYPVQK